MFIINGRVGRVGEALIPAGNPEPKKNAQVGEKLSESVPRALGGGRPSEKASPTLPPSRVLNVGVQV